MTLRKIETKELSACAKLLLQYARETALHRADDIEGFIIVAWTKDGSTTASGEVSKGSIPRVLIPAFITEVIRRDFLIDNEIKAELRSLGIIDGPPIGS